MTDFSPVVAHYGSTTTNGEPPTGMGDALADSGIGTLKGLVRGTGIPDLASALTWVAGEAHGPLALSSLLNSSRIGEEDREGLDTIYDKYFGVLGDEVSEEKAQEKVNPMRGNYLETVQKIVDNIVPFESNENARITEKIMELMVAGVDLAFLLWTIGKNAPKGFKYVMDKLKKTGTENVDESVPLLTDQRVDAAVTKATGEDLNVKTTIDATPGGPDYDKSGTMRKKHASEIDTDKLFKRQKNRGKKAHNEEYYARQKIIKEYEKRGIKNVGRSERGREIYTIPEGMTHEQMVGQVEEMRDKIYGGMESIRKKWNNMDIVKDEAADIVRARDYWTDKVARQKVVFENPVAYMPEEVTLALDKLPSEIRTEIATRLVNNPEWRALAKTMNEDVQKVMKSYHPLAEIGDVEMNKQVFLLREKHMKNQQDFLTKQIKSEVEFYVGGDPLEAKEEILMKKGAYKDITRHARGGSVQNSVDYALDQWR